MFKGLGSARSEGRTQKPETNSFTDVRPVSVAGDDHASETEAQPDGSEEQEQPELTDSIQNMAGNPEVPICVHKIDHYADNLNFLSSLLPVTESATKWTLNRNKCTNPARHQALYNCCQTFRAVLNWNKKPQLMCLGLLLY